MIVSYQKIGNTLEGTFTLPTWSRISAQNRAGTRPVVVLQNDVGNRYAPTLIVATVTSRTEKKKHQPTHVLIDRNTAFEKPSVVQLEQIFTIDKSRVQRFLGQITRNEMRRIEEALMNSLEINEWDRRNADE